MAALNKAKLVGREIVLKMIGRQEARICTTSNVAEDHPVPAGAKYARLTASALAYVKGDGTAAAPAGDVTDGTGSIKLDANIPVWFDVTGVTNISCVSATAGAIIQISFVEAFD